MIDSNIFMYAAGKPHPNKSPSVDLLDRVARGNLEAFVDAEVLQEILHRYRAIGRWKEGRLVYDLARKLVRTVVPITVEVIDSARILLDESKRLTARDALHVAACQQWGGTAICSYDKDLDDITSVKRVEPQEVR